MSVGYRREDTKKNKDEQKRRIKNRYNVTIDESNYRFFPAKKQLDYYDNDVPQRVAVYARVSTDNVAQTTSYELQRKYYEEFVTRHPNWTLVHIYADEGISGTSTLKRDEFVKMNSDLCTIIHGEQTEDLIIKIYIMGEDKEKDILTIKLRGVNNLINFNHMFYKCSNLISVKGLSKVDTSKIVRMTSMFNKCFGKYR